MVAFGCDPDGTMEKRNGWRRLLIAAEYCDATVLIGPNADPKKLLILAEQELGKRHGVTFLRVEQDGWGKFFDLASPFYYLRYRWWNNRAYQVARRLHEAEPFDISHQVNFCGYREPGLLWRLEAPFVWGPVGGTQDYPLRFLGQIAPLAAARELCRSLINRVQLRFSPRVRGAARGAAVVLAANSAVQRDLRTAAGVRSLRQLETGLDCEIAKPRTARDTTQPLKILWAGRLQPWKGFPLLARAIATMPNPSAVRIRVLGKGPCLASWKRLTTRLGVDEQFEWIDWPEYEATLPHYQWADAFAFTSLRDTSGTGLLEALAAGAPIIGLDHQGAADIMTDDCAIKAPVNSPHETIRHIAAAITDLAEDSAKLLRLSRGAQARAAEYRWELRSDWTRDLYCRAMDTAASRAKAGKKRPAASAATTSERNPTVGIAAGTANQYSA